MVTPLSVETMKYLQLKQRILVNYPQADEETLIRHPGRNHRPPRDDSRGDPLGASG